MRCCSHSRHVVLATAITIVVMLLLCPAVTRIIHVQQLGKATPSTSYAPSFQKSLDVPPDPQIASPDLTIVPVPLENLTTFVVTHWPRPVDDALTWSFLGSSTRPLRAPPVRLS